MYVEFHCKLLHVHHVTCTSYNVLISLYLNSLGGIEKWNLWMKKGLMIEEISRP